jgi:hypothetical protein
MARAALVVGVLVLVVASGCLTADPAGTAPADPTTSASDAPYELEEPDIDDSRNPWGVSEIEVVVEDTTASGENVHPAVMKTTRYWENEIDPGQRYAPEFRVVSESESPEIRVEIVKTVDDCGVHRDEVGLGCAPVVPTNATVTDKPVTIQVRAGHSHETTLAILKHEFGHVLGYEHGEGPNDLMTHNLTANAPDDVIDAAERDYPWASDSLRVAIVAESGADVTERERVRQALAYYERGADGTVASPPEFEVVADANEADVVVDLRDAETVECEGVSPRNSCLEWDGPDVDDDDAVEYVTDARIVVGSESHERVGWHVGYWLGRSLWTHGVPDPFLTDNQLPVSSW